MNLSRHHVFVLALALALAPITACDASGATSGDGGGGQAPECDPSASADGGAGGAKPSDCDLDGISSGGSAGGGPSQNASASSSASSTASVGGSSASGLPNDGGSGPGEGGGGGSTGATCTGFDDSSVGFVDVPPSPPGFVANDYCQAIGGAACEGPISDRDLQQCKSDTDFVLSSAPDNNALITWASMVCQMNLCSHGGPGLIADAASFMTACTQCLGDAWGIIGF